LSTPKICLVGQTLVDVTLSSAAATKMRLGGIAHAARALWALDARYTVGFVCPTYLAAQSRDFLAAHGAADCAHVGVVDGAPNVMLVSHAEEAGPQGYELLLRDDHAVSLDVAALERMLADPELTAVLAFPDADYFDRLAPLLPVDELPLYLDGDLDPARFGEFGLRGRVGTAILSTSSKTFMTSYGASVQALCDAAITGPARELLFKENRGGSQLFAADGSLITAPAHVRPVVHSVGVGDCFDAALCHLRHAHDDQTAMAYASAIAADYASTLDPDTFKAAVAATLAIRPTEIVELVGVIVPWERRREHPIYVAAPDFDWVDRRSVDHVAAALRYHGFVPRLPVRENGQLAADATSGERQRVVEADLTMLDECSLVVAVLLFDDPGTLVEVGLALERGLPVVVYDPNRRARNPMLTELPTRVTTTLDETIAAVFEVVGRLLAQ
jgi:nucleoside 2-deoxyribosyltransferase